ncbi:MAG TPA: hypothetical protein VJ842_17910 [Pyrinomonadaceae bacterium]|nr:hypothetical protein [Pyrinomonadaceae bacterium]
MPTLDTLDTVIAMVVVLLVLSLVVQSIQTFVKKLLKMKSRSIQASLEDLFQHVLGVDEISEASRAGGDGANVTPPAGGAGGNAAPPAGVEGGNVTPPAGVEGGAVPTAGGANVAVAAPVKATQADVQNLLNQVNKQFAALGRVTLTGRLMLDSLAKNDLLKVLTKVGADRLTPDAVKRFQELLTEVQTLQEELGKVKTELLAGEASAKFAAMRDALAPLINDLEAVLGGDTKPATVIFGDLAKLRQIKVADVLSLLGEVQQRVEQDRADAQKAGETQKAAELEEVAGKLRGIAAKIAALGQAFDRAFGQLRAKLEEVETWYDTVMQGFEERYTRHMRTVTFMIGAIVVVILNANFFTLYHNLSTDPELRASVVAQGEAIDARLKKEAEAAASPSPSPSPSPATSPSPASGASPTATATPSPTPSAEELKKIIKDFEDEQKKLREATDTFGLHPITAEEINDFTESLLNDKTPDLDADGHPIYKTNETPPKDCEKYSSGKKNGPKCEKQRHAMSPEEKRAFWRNNFSVLLGWAIMAMLLSVGAPFWQDTLESLFGIKNLLRKRSDTKNIEDDKGGQPRP